MGEDEGDDTCRKVLSGFAVEGNGTKGRCKGTVEWREVVSVYFLKNG